MAAQCLCCAKLPMKFPCRTHSLYIQGLESAPGSHYKLPCTSQYQFLLAFNSKNTCSQMAWITRQTITSTLFLFLLPSPSMISNSVRQFVSLRNPWGVIILCPNTFLAASKYTVLLFTLLLIAKRITLVLPCHTLRGSCGTTRLTPNNCSSDLLLQ